MTTSTRMAPPSIPWRPLVGWERYLQKPATPPGGRRRPRSCHWRLRRHRYRPGAWRLTATLGWEWCDVCHRWVAPSTTDLGVR